MHSPIDIIGGLALGLIILAFWLGVHNYVDDFIVAGQNGTLRTYFTTLQSLLILSYLKPLLYMQMSS